MAIITEEKMQNLDTDIHNAGEAINEKKVIVPRYGDPFNSFPLAIEKVENMGGFISAATLDDLIARTPAYNYQLARVDETGDEYRWNPLALPTPQWEPTGKNYLSDAESYVNLKTSPLLASMLASLIKLDKTISSDTSILLKEVSKMLIKSVKNTSETNKLTVSIDNNSENSASIVLLPNESVSNNIQTDLWSKLSMNSADFTKVVVASTNGWRIQYQYYAYAFDKAVDKYNVFDKNSIFESRTQVNLESATGIAISSHGGGYLQFYVPTSVLTAAGLPNNAEAADGYLIPHIAQSDIFAIQRNSTLTKNIDEILLNKGSLVIDFTGNHTSTLETYVLEKPKVLDVTNLDFKQYIADVKNSTGVALTNQPIELKVNF
ncbi:hypothetical protein F4T72_15820, partial [Acinetobacter pittii]|nr:hypothetical protein [Acinetobacter pittii]